MIRTIRGLAVWVAAAWVVLGLVRRIVRGEVVVLSAHGAPVVRLLAIVLVFLASCAEKLRPGAPAEQTPQDLSQKPAGATPGPAPVVEVAQEFPDDLDDAALQRMYNWVEARTLHYYFASERPDAAAGDVRDAPAGSAQKLPFMTGLAGDAANERAAVFIRGVDEHVARGPVHAAADLLALLDAAEGVPLYDEWLAAHLWRHARTLRPAPVALLARIERHLRVTHALVLGQASTGPVEFSAWRSKAGPPPGWNRMRVPAGLAAAAREAFKQGADAGTWETEAALELTVARGEVVLVRRAGETRLAAGAPLRLRRLDVVRAAAAAALRHPLLGELALPAGAEVTAWTVGERLGAAGRAAVQARVSAALAGDAAALTELEGLLPAAHAELRAAAGSKPSAPGAAALRMLLVGFDE